MLNITVFSILTTVFEVPILLFVTAIVSIEMSGWGGATPDLMATDGPVPLPLAGGVAIVGQGLGLAFTARDAWGMALMHSLPSALDSRTFTATAMHTSTSASGSWLKLRTCYQFTRTRP